MDTLQLAKKANFIIFVAFNLILILLDAAMFLFDGFDFAYHRVASLYMAPAVSFVVSWFCLKAELYRKLLASAVLAVMFTLAYWLCFFLYLDLILPYVGY